MTALWSEVHLVPGKLLCRTGNQHCEVSGRAELSPQYKGQKATRGQYGRPGEAWGVVSEPLQSAVTPQVPELGSAVVVVNRRKHHTPELFTEIYL